MNIIKIFLLMSLMILLIRKKMAIGVVLFLSAFLVGILFSELIDLPFYFYESLTSYLFFKILIIIYFVFLMSSVLKYSGINSIINGIVNLIPNLKIAMIIPPMTIGLLPMPGGAMLPAPIIDSIGDKLNMKNEHKVYVNFWFRHIWEYAWPLYPGLILTVSILKIPMKTLILHQFYLIIIAFFIGMIFIKLFVKDVYQKRNLHILVAIKEFLRGIWPILLIIIFILFSPFRVEFIVLSISIIYWLISKIPIKQKLKLLYKSISFEMIMLIVGLITFKDMLVNSNALNLFIESFPQTDILPLLFIIILPFIIGFLTGINQGYVGIALPVLIPFLYTSGSIDILRVTIFYASGFAGILISPAHLCLSLTVEYFKSDLNKVYKYLIPSIIPIFLIPIIIYLLRR